MKSLRVLWYLLTGRFDPQNDPMRLDIRDCPCPKCHPPRKGEAMPKTDQQPAAREKP
jgi:hypothetical protein